ncbi:MAG TPA: DUF1365 domain-containing protein [Vibrio sp.]|uniref:DUF1365 domain-containing protein n=1 Tax=Vibrio TaxID=662 RepID=UPI00041A0388|nr:MULTISPECIES: DUF1365 domain-containing protein [Vibrio]HCH02802.1 DUF1365 domain-containing protein [Vibrio sp.]
MTTSAQPFDFQHGIYKGKVRHRRFSPVLHSFNYPITMLGINVAELDSLNDQHWAFGTQWYKPVRFAQKDYIKSEPGELLQRIKSKVANLGGEWDGENAVMLAQCRCLGVYFSPVNFYFCFEKSGNCKYMLAEVSNTPWNQRHYYLVDMYLVNMQSDQMTDKAFHVSPFMQMNMKYKWRVNAPEDKAFVHIENHDKDQQGKKVFDATIALSKLDMKNKLDMKASHPKTKRPNTSQSATKLDWLALPFMNFKVLQGIYWQALKLFRKKVPFVPYSKT